MTSKQTITLTIAILIGVFSYDSFAQNNTSNDVVTKNYTLPKAKTVDISKVKTDWYGSLKNIKEPQVGNKSYREYLKDLKIEIANKYPRKYQKSIENNNNIFVTDTPKVLKGFESNEFSYAVPLDNTVAISNDNILISAKNANIYIFDVKKDTLLKKISLTAFTDTNKVVNILYDPKLLYDPKENKFILVYLSGMNDSTTHIVVAFSATADPTGKWNYYYIEGNPLNDVSWSDFPAIALSNDELFITMNLLKNSETWQNSFKRSIIWQIGKLEGYKGDSIKTKLWSNINFNNKPIRNLFPVQGGSNLTGPNMYFLSNRNFTIQNDTIFMIQITNNQFSNPSININYMLTEKCYGAPPTANQPKNLTLQTNDARVLGGFIENNKIQFVANTIDTATGNAAIFHGIIRDVKNINSKVYSNIIYDKLLDYGYPNISYTGTSKDEDYSIITFNHTSPYENPGFSAMFFEKENSYSKAIMLKRGTNFLLYYDKNERWGDYSGSQRKYNEPGKVWVTGTFGKKQKVGLVNYNIGSTWVAQLEAPFIAKKDIPVPPPSEFKALAYPSPSNDIVNIKFDLPDNKSIRVTIYDRQNKLVKLLYDGVAKGGYNILTFSTNPLNAGMYFVNINDDKNNIMYSQKIVVTKN